MKTYFQDKLDSTLVEAEIELDGHGVIANGNLVSLCLGEDMNLYSGNNHVVIDLDKSQSIVYSYKKQDERNVLEILAFALSGHALRMVVEDFDRESDAVAEKFYSFLISPSKLEISDCRFWEDEQNEKNA